MAFDNSSISALTIAQAGPDLLISWQSSATPGCTFQVYLGARLTWWGTDLSTRVPSPATLTRIDVGVVADGEGPTDFSSSLPSAPLDRATLSWQGGSFLAGTLPIAGYKIFASAVAGGAISYTKPIASVPAYHGVVTDGWNFGTWNAGGWGRSIANYSWTSNRLGPGVWNFAVVPFDSAGNLSSSPATTTVTIASPPLPPAPFSSGARLTYSFNAGTGIATLNWNPSPS